MGCGNARRFRNDSRDLKEAVMRTAGTVENYQQ